MSSRMKTTNSVNVELLLFLVANLSATVKSVTAQSISRSNIFDTDDEMAQLWEMLHWSTQDDMAADVNAALSGIDETLSWLW